MNDSDRFHRDDPKRTRPRRSMSGTLRNEDPWSVRPAPDRPGQFREANNPGEESSEDPRNEHGNTRNENGDNGVHDAYRVADDNIREGQWRAGSRNQRGYDWRPPGYGSGPPFGYGTPGYGQSYGPGYNSPFGYPNGGRPSDGLLEQIMRTYMDMMGLMGTMINGIARPPYPSYPSYPPYPRPFEGRHDPDLRRGSDSLPRGHSAAVRVEVTANQANQVALDLKELPPRISLSVPPLRALNNGKPELNDIRFDAANDRYTLRIRIPDGHPSGLYSGVIVESRTGEPCGTLAVQVGQPTPPRGPTRPTKNHKSKNGSV